LKFFRNNITYKQENQDLASFSHYSHILCKELFRLLSLSLKFWLSCNLIL